jgi:nucleotide-binding universal stress UspA family protein
MSYNKIVIAVDDSPHAINTAKRGLELAKQLQSAVGFVFVIDIDMEAINGELFINRQNSMVLLMKEAEANIKKIAEKYAKDLNIEYFTLEGMPKKEIISKATEWNADIIVMGIHGRTGLEHLLLGSVAEYIIRHSPIPVLVVPKVKNK